MGYNDHQTRPTITTITFTDGVTEQSHVFDANMKKFDISSRFGKTFKIAYVENGTIGNDYKTIPQDSGYFENFIKDVLTIFILVPNASTNDSEVIEILEWQSTD